MTTLTANQIEDMRGDLGIDNTQTVFTDYNLQRLYDRDTADALNGANVYERAIAYGYRQLLAAASKLHDMKTGTVSETLSQVVTHLESQYMTWAKLAGIAGGSISVGTFSYAIDEPWPVSVDAAIMAYLTAFRNA